MVHLLGRRTRRRRNPHWPQLCADQLFMVRVRHARRESHHLRHPLSTSRRHVARPSHFEFPWWHVAGARTACPPPITRPRAARGSGHVACTSTRARCNARCRQPIWATTPLGHVACPSHPTSLGGTWQVPAAYLGDHPVAASTDDRLFSSITGTLTFYDPTQVRHLRISRSFHGLPRLSQTGVLTCHPHTRRRRTWRRGNSSQCRLSNLDLSASSWAWSKMMSTSHPSPSPATTLLRMLAAVLKHRVARVRVRLANMRFCVPHAAGTDKLSARSRRSTQGRSSAAMGRRSCCAQRI